MTTARICRQATASSPNTPTAERTRTSTPARSAGGALTSAGRHLAAGAYAVYRAIAVAALTVLVIGAGLIPRRGRRPPRHALRRTRRTTR